MARPNADARKKAILAALAEGCTRTAAAGLGGVDRATLYRWMEEDATFRDDVTRAEADAEAYFTRALVRAAGPQVVTETRETTDEAGNTSIITVTRCEYDWRAGESWLKRRRRKEWGDSLDLKNLTPEQIIAVLDADDASQAGS